MAELLNNLGCAYFETGTEVKALKCFKESLQTQKKSLFDSVYDGNDPLQQHHLLRLASTRANIGYTLMRMKNTQQAIDFFKDSLLDQNLCLDPHHPLVISTMENLAISFIKRGSKDRAVQIYSKMLTAEIEARGAEHNKCIAILTKLSLLHLRGNEKEGVRSCINKIQACLRDNDLCQKERFDKLLKVCKVSGLKTVTVGRKK
jgi:tetratricopeptide (TPR) repeat protein